MLKGLYYLIQSTTEPFYTVIWQTRYFFIDYWSLVHFANGFIIMLILQNMKVRRPSVMLTFLLLLWEIVELWFVYAAIDVFRPEIIPDQFTDLIIGLLGGLARLKVSCRQKATRWRLGGVYQFSPDMLAELAVAVGMACIWVTYYDYTYNVPFFNSPGLNWFACTLWSLWLFFILCVYNFWHYLLNSTLMSLAATWLVYFPLLLLFEGIGYYILEIRLVTTESPLMFGLIHGTPTLKGFYLIACFLAVFLSYAFKAAIKMCFPKAQPILWKDQKIGFNS
ncbi:hypothetical protein Desac_0478 [Desulfobacca acetoxidans DSM 11109]|uniref:Transmembrane protein n=2 Tax=Desulfobacca acetoxidans TaxID=60893 RepID=F2NF24_DESAR|nr:hypothetical protein Desac_0478 [Desulfobacca acetoxidans DSM 11109]